MPHREKIAELVEWFEKRSRPFPWRKLTSENPSFAYAIWVSEVMLQQTRAEVVIPYFSAWMQKYPTIESLAKAPLDEVIKAWEGLGYYSRARRLWQGARYLIERNCGRLPESYEELLEIPGFGPYTAGAVASFAFHKRAAAIDGNVTRVLARLFAINDPVDKSPAQKKIEKHVLELLPESKPWVAMEALIELGATLCAKRPKCASCPLEQICLARKQGVAEGLPIKSRKEKIERLYRDVAVIMCNGKILVGKVEKGKIMADLYEFPYFETGKLKEWIKNEMKILQRMDCIEHSFTRFRVLLYPYLIQCEKEIPLNGYNWISMEKLHTLPFSSGHRKILGLL
jgi:A/G-specific adenine glycosylase